MGAKCHDCISVFFVEWNIADYLTELRPRLPFCVGGAASLQPCKFDFCSFQSAENWSAEIA